jgi:hypothetical protein
MNVDCGDFLYELWIRTDDARRFASERRIRTDAAVHDLMDAEPALLDDCGERDNEILDVGRAGPEIVHSTNRRPRTAAATLGQPAMHLLHTR